MKTTFILILFILLFASGALYFLVQAEGGLQAIPRLIERVGIPLPTFKQAPTPNANPEFTSGNSRFSQESCILDTDCVQSGCSGEVCGNSTDTVSTCEFSSDFPNVQGYSCGCVNRKCGWEK